MKEFLQLMRRFVSPYKKYIGWAVLLNILSAVFNVFSFTFLIPILSILFKTEGADKVYHFMEWGSGDLADVAKNNFYYYISQMIIDNGPTMALIFLGLFLMIMTLFKTGCYFASSAVMIPLRTGVVRDIRIMVYAKVMRLPMSFFSEERKGDIIARMSGDVGEVENSITSSLDMLMKSPIMIILYFATLVITSWQLTLFTIVVLPGMAGFSAKRRFAKTNGWYRSRHPRSFQCCVFPHSNRHSHSPVHKPALPPSFRIPPCQAAIRC